MLILAQNLRGFENLQKYEIVLGLCIAHTIFKMCEHLVVKLHHTNIFINSVYLTLEILRNQLSEMRCTDHSALLYNRAKLLKYKYGLVRSKRVRY